MRSRAKVILINGSFGVGKTTVARAVRGLLEDSAIYDPEYVGSALRRLPRWIALQGSGSDDFQHMPAWRRSVVLGTRVTGLLHGGPVVVPMAFDSPAYFSEIWGGIRAAEPTAMAFCLTATLATIRARLASRGTDPDEPWVARRTRECVRAHADDRFGERIDSEARSAEEVARVIVQRVLLPERAGQARQPR